MQDIEKEIDSFLDNRLDLLVDDLKSTGKKLVDKARLKTKSEGGFGNITWNLRASIGCLILRDHNVVFTYFPPISKSNEGHQKGIGYANEIARLVDDGGIILVIVAGMEYAAAVENRHDLDVISGSCEDFENEFLKLVRS